MGREDDLAIELGALLLVSELQCGHSIRMDDDENPRLGTEVCRFLAYGLSVGIQRHRAVALYFHLDIG